MPQPITGMYSQPAGNNYQSYPSSGTISLIKVPSMEAINNYNLVPGNYAMFMHETEPYMFIKTAPLSPLEQPILEIYKLTKVDKMDGKNVSDDYDIRKELQSMEKRIKKLESVHSKTKFHSKPRKPAKPTDA